MCGSRKYPYPQNGGNSKFHRVESKAKEILERRGLSVKLPFQMVKFDALQVSIKIVP